MYLLWREGIEGRKRGRETSGEIHRWVASHTTLAGNLACNPGMCSDGELNWWPFGSQAGTQSTEPCQPGPKAFSYQLDSTWLSLTTSSNPVLSFLVSDFWNKPSFIVPILLHFSYLPGYLPTTYPLCSKPSCFHLQPSSIPTYSTEKKSDREFQFKSQNFHLTSMETWVYCPLWSSSKNICEACLMF